MTGPRVTLVSRVGCHLCDEAAGLLGRLGVEFATVDVDSREDWKADYGDLVPVVLLDGKQIDWGRIDAARLEQVLAKRLAQKPGRWRPW